MSLFFYQKTKHKRKLSPGPFTTYKPYKKHLRIEFDSTCVYCRMPDSLSEWRSYAVEHYRPQNKFPELATEYSNLFYSCLNCNSRKGYYWPDENQMLAGRFIPNPCDHVMYQHLRAQPEGSVKPYSFAGEWTIDLLSLNSPEQIKKSIRIAITRKISNFRFRNFKRSMRA